MTKRRGWRRGNYKEEKGEEGNTMGRGRRGDLTRSGGGPWEEGETMRGRGETIWRRGGMVNKKRRDDTTAMKGETTQQPDTSTTPIAQNSATDVPCQ